MYSGFDDTKKKYGPAVIAVIYAAMIVQTILITPNVYLGHFSNWLQLQ